RGDEISFVHTPGFVVDVQHAPADHDRHEHRQRDRAGQKILHVLDVGIEFYDIERSFLQQPGFDGGLIERVGQVRQFLLQRGTHEIVAVIYYQGDPGMVLLVDAPRILWRNNHRALDLAIAHILHRLLVVVVVHRLEGANVGAHGIEGLANFERLGAAVLVHYSEARVAYLAAEGVAQHDQLHQGKYHGGHHQRRGTEELAHFALDNRHHSVHGCIPGRGGMTKPYDLTSSSRSWRPV